MTTIAGGAPGATTRPLDPSIVTPIATRSRLRIALGWLWVAIVFAVALELTCRIEDWVMYRMPMMSRYTSLEDLVIRDAKGMHGRPNAKFEKWTMNSLGMRGPETTVAPAAGTVRVVAVGASETFGLRESPGREYPRQLSDSIAGRIARGACGGEPERFEVINAGFAGMSLPTIDQDVRMRVRDLQPGVIFVYPAPAQYLEEEPPVAAVPDSSARLTEPPFSRALRPRVLGRIREQLKALLPEWLKTGIRVTESRKAVAGHPDNWRFTTVPQDRVARFEDDLRHLVGTIRSVGAEPVLATHANEFLGRRAWDHNAVVAWEKFYPRATGQTLIAFDSVARLAILRVAADSGVVAVDAARRLAAAPPSAFADFVHFTDMGASYMADIASDGVLSAARRIGHCRSASPR
jgi:hypothetical protein